jgi:protein phosphatase
VLWVLIPLILIGGALFVVKRFFVDNQWFVGVSNGHVAIFRGIPAQPLGLDLATLDRETDLPAEEVSQFSAWESLAEGITADSEQDAESIVTQMREDLEAREAQEKKPKQQGGQGP